MTHEEKAREILHELKDSIEPIEYKLIKEGAVILIANAIVSAEKKGREEGFKFAKEHTGSLNEVWEANEK